MDQWGVNWSLVQYHLAISSSTVAHNYALHFIWLLTTADGWMGGRKQRIFALWGFKDLVMAVSKFYEIFGKSASNGSGLENDGDGDGDDDINNDVDGNGDRVWKYISIWLSMKLEVEM